MDKNMMTDWPVLLGQMIQAKNAMVDVDPEYYDDYTLPSEHAEVADIEAFERRLRESLPSEYRNFLTHANGWEKFYWDADLFGLRELAHAEGFFEHARRLVGEYESGNVLDEAGVEVRELIPIGAGDHSATLFCLLRESSQNPGQVLWLHHEVVERFTDFAEFFKAMIEGLLADVEAVRQGAV
ncbi:SMI1/KNR4 family protein [Actinomadura gamaensis]|uniref:SMI1/KNR4 family protein n=1 Tax=Actinomadura gamaensis TaxID=1763541 RepID=A0ABV9U919_9ACTN